MSLNRRRGRGVWNWWEVVSATGYSPEHALYSFAVAHNGPPKLELGQRDNDVPEAVDSTAHVELREIGPWLLGPRVVGLGLAGSDPR